MKLGLFGGSFNPIHTGHLIVIDQAMDQLNLDQIIVVPAACNPLKMNMTDMAPAEHRLTMAMLAVDIKNTLVLDMEIKRGAPSYAIDTVKELLQEKNWSLHHPKIDEIVLIMGGDSYYGIPTWHKAEELLGLVKLGIAERKWTPFRSVMFDTKENQIHWMYSRIKSTVIDIPTFDTSGSEVRSRIKAGRSIRYLVPEVVEKYIRNNGLYLTR